MKRLLTLALIIFALAGVSVAQGGSAASPTLKVSDGQKSFNGVNELRVPAGCVTFSGRTAIINCTGGGSSGTTTSQNGNLFFASPNAAYGLPSWRAILEADLPAISQSKVTNLVSDLAGKQPLDTDLTVIAALTPTNDDLLQRKSGAWTNRTPAQVKTDLALTKSDVGLGNVDNTSDASKPVSTAQQATLDLKANLASPSFTGTPLAPTAAAATNSTQIATTAHVFAERTNTATLTNKTLSSPSFTGTVATALAVSVASGAPADTHLTAFSATNSTSQNYGHAATFENSNSSNFDVVTRFKSNYGTGTVAAFAALEFYRTASGIGNGNAFHFSLNNAAGTETEYGGFVAGIEDNTVASEDGYLAFVATVGGAVRQERARITSTGNFSAAGSVTGATLSLGGGITWSKAAGAPAGACTTGSLYTNTTTGALSVCESAAWVTK